MARSKPVRRAPASLDRQILRHLAGLAEAGSEKDPYPAARALAQLTARALPGATAYVVYTPAHGRKVGDVAAVAGLPSDAFPQGLLAPERFEMVALQAGAVHRGRVPSWPEIFFVAAPVHSSEGTVMAVLVTLHATRPTRAAIEAQLTLATLGGAVTGRGGTSRVARPSPELEALAAELNRQLVAGLDALPEILTRLSEAMGSLGARCLVLNAEGNVEVIASAGAARDDITERPDRELLQRLLAPRSLVRINPAEAPMLSVPGAVELVVVPLVTQDAVQGGLVFAFDRRQVNPWVAMLVAEHMASVVLRSRQADDGLGAATDWDRALTALDAVVWTTDAHHNVLRANGAARKLLRSATATCRDVLGRHCPDVCAGGARTSRLVVAAGGRYLVRALPFAGDGGGLYVALPESDESAAALPHLGRTAQDAGVTWTADAEATLAGVDASLSSVLQDLHRVGTTRGTEDRLRGIWHAVSGLRRSGAVASETLRRPLREPDRCDMVEILEVALTVARARTRGPTEFSVEIGELPMVVGDRDQLLEGIGAMLADPKGLVEIVARATGNELEIRVTGGASVVPSATERLAHDLDGYALVDSVGGLLLRFPVRRRGGFMPTIPPLSRSSDTERPAARDRKSRILVVDDEPEVRNAYSRCLRGLPDVAVETAADGVEALERMTETDFDVIVTDVLMPRMGGLDLYSEVSMRWPALLPRIVFMTGGVFGAEADDFLRTTANPVLTKPVPLQDLLDAVSSVLERTNGW